MTPEKHIPITALQEATTERVMSIRTLKRSFDKALEHARSNLPSGVMPLAHGGLCLRQVKRRPSRHRRVSYALIQSFI